MGHQLSIWPAYKVDLLSPEYKDLEFLNSSSMLNFSHSSIFTHSQVPSGLFKLKNAELVGISITVTHL